MRGPTDPIPPASTTSGSRPHQPLEQDVDALGLRSCRFRGTEDAVEDVERHGGQVGLGQAAGRSASFACRASGRRTARDRRIHEDRLAVLPDGRAGLACRLRNAPQPVRRARARGTRRQQQGRQEARAMHRFTATAAHVSQTRRRRPRGWRAAGQDERAVTCGRTSAIRRSLAPSCRRRRARPDAARTSNAVSRTPRCASGFGAPPRRGAARPPVCASCRDDPSRALDDRLVPPPKRKPNAAP